MGNRLSAHDGSYAYNEGNELTSGPKASYQYDRNGNLVMKTTSEGATSYAYDYENRLSKVVMPDGTVVEFAYDPFGRRIEKSVNGAATRYLYDNEDILFEYDSTGAVGNKYIHGLGIDEPLALVRDKNTYYYHADGLGSIVALTDSAQKVVQTYEYDSFGNLKDMKNAVKQPYTFTGREYDRETGLYYYRARYYDAEAGRFISFDPILRLVKKDRKSCSGKFKIPSFGAMMSTPKSLNPFVYAENNPAIMTDPSGLTSNEQATGDLCFEKMRQRISSGSCPDWTDCFECCGDLMPFMFDEAIMICTGVCEEALDLYKKNHPDKCCK